MELCNLQQHTEMRWLSIGPAIKRILEQYEAITLFVVEVMKDSKKVPKSVNFKSSHAAGYKRESIYKSVT